MSVPPPALPVLDFSQIGPKVGERFPDIRLPDQRGQVVDLHTARKNRRAMLVIFRSINW